MIGAGMFGAYCTEKIYRHANLRVLVLDASGFLVSEHIQSFQDAPVGGGAYRQIEREIGVSSATDYISGPLYDELHAKMDAVIKAPGGLPIVGSVNDHDTRAPLSVQAAQPASGYLVSINTAALLS